MEQMGVWGLLLGGSWASGINLYLTIAGLGLAHRFEWITLPGEASILAHGLVIGVALFLFVIEWFADKIPVVDSSWDSIHTFIRPIGGLSLGYMAMTESDPAIQLAVALLTGTIALDAHLTKATSRAMINASPEPFSNSVASLIEDFSVLSVLLFIIKFPLLAIIFTIFFIFGSIWFLIKMGGFLKKSWTKDRKAVSN